MSVLVVGTVAQDTIETPFGSAPYVLGGSATFFSWAASFFTPVHLVGVVGEDFPPQYQRLLAERGIDLTGLKTQPGGKTFYWHGRYLPDMNQRETLEVQLNVIADFDPVLPPPLRQIPYVFLANINPWIQAKILSQMEQRPKLVVADTMDFWIETQRPGLIELLPKLDGLVLNDGEAKLLTGENNLIRAGEKVRSMGPKFVIVKKGEHGSYLLTKDGPFLLPGYPTANVVDPTGAGDSFAGGMMGYLAADGSGAPGSLRRAIAYGSVVASITVEDFGLESLKRAHRADIDHRLEDYRKMLAF
ncbi:MAG TPA: PfkB family carbohydrate kinase [Gemmatales bacterium]|nr:PfkB family carbohydrate kinase [Gemmatales bacterium]HMP60396.1 PfkB family carbohydrate kinase [Gemmatales bacterium]